MAQTDSITKKPKQPAIKSAPATNDRSPGSRTLDIDTDDFAQIVKQVRSGFPIAKLRKFQKATDLSWEKVSIIANIPKRTLARRQAQGRLQSDESDRLWRAARIFDLTIDLFEGNRQAARDWLLTPQPALAGNTPLELTATDRGARQVENLITQLEHGVFP